MPPVDAWLAQLPAQVDLASVAQAGEVDQSQFEIFHRDAELIDLGNALHDALAQLGDLGVAPCDGARPRVAVALRLDALARQPLLVCGKLRPQRLHLAQERLGTPPQRPPPGATEITP